MRETGYRTSGVRREISYFPKEVTTRMNAKVTNHFALGSTPPKLQDPSLLSSLQKLSDTDSPLLVPGRNGSPEQESDSASEHQRQGAPHEPGDRRAGINRRPFPFISTG